VDLIFTEPHAVLPAWQVTAATLPGIDDHFWDWMLWLAAKQQAGKAGLVAAQLAKLHEHLLAPLGVRAQPATPAQFADLDLDRPVGPLGDRPGGVPDAGMAAKAAAGDSRRPPCSYRRFRRHPCGFSRCRTMQISAWSEPWFSP
jgi:hypothetical protein